MEIVRKKSNEIIKIQKSIVTERTNAFNRLIRSHDKLAHERIHELEDRSIEIVQTGTQREK